MSKTNQWEFNCWTGNYHLRIDDSVRIIRMAGGGLYSAEHWGDYSLKFPIKGPWCKTLQQAKRSIASLRKEAEAA